MNISSAQKKHFRKIAHQLKPVVLIGDKGLSPAILKEVDRALEDHELIKVKVSGADRTEKSEMSLSICRKSQAQLIQSVGNVILLYRAAKNPNPKLSNLLKAAAGSKED